MPVPTPLSRKQEHAVVALLSCHTIAEAAQQCRIAEATLHRWLKEEVFQAAYLQARREAMRQAIAQLQRASCIAVRTLVAVMEDGMSSSAARVSAARTVLELGMNGIVLEDFDTRLKVLEAQEIERST